MSPLWWTLSAFLSIYTDFCFLHNSALAALVWFASECLDCKRNWNSAKDGLLEFIPARGRNPTLRMYPSWTGFRMCGALWWLSLPTFCLFHKACRRHRAQYVTDSVKMPPAIEDKSSAMTIFTRYHSFENQFNCNLGRESFKSTIILSLSIIYQAHAQWAHSASVTSVMWYVD